ncbi:energy transducer TonB [Ideonella oryzae]|uniref:Energy transducer TonB n=1 Tax=Ideonella oryzae TaxID=2937441 RepID=A0ABT1BPJ1_9BURK|nr:energy transducer TonB [Ideonella oryzae]MCO5978136.1 energy transducer TonB [Ideonella oryzae]
MGRRWVRQADAIALGLGGKAAPAVRPLQRQLVRTILLWPLCAASWAQSAPPAPVPVPDTQGIEISDRVKRDAERPMYWIRRLGEQTAGQDKATQERSATERQNAAEKLASEKAAAERAARAARTEKPEKQAPAPRPAPPEPTTPAPALATRDTARPSPTSASDAAPSRPAPAPAPALASAEPATTGASAADVPVAHAASPSTESDAPAPDRASATDVAMTTPEHHPEPAAPPPSPVAETLVLRPGESLALPDSLMRRMRRGSVEVRVQVAPDGSVMDATIVQSSHPRLDQAALDAIKAAHFQPVSRPTSAVIQFGFDLDS